MAQNKSGLHKKISSIFDGVPVPKAGDEQLPSSQSMDSKGHLPPVPSPSARQPVHIPAAMPRTYDTAQPQPDIFAKPSRQGVPEYIVEKLSALKLGNLADKQKIKILIVPILAIILILVLYRNFAGPAKPVSSDPETQNAKNAADAPNFAAGIVWQKPEPYPMYMRDPTQVGATGSYTSEAGGIAVRGIVYSKDRPAVVIGTEIKHEGETIGEATIVRIDQNSVKFDMHGKIWTQRVQ